MTPEKLNKNVALRDTLV
jgi:bloom syndrome protein